MEVLASRLEQIFDAVSIGEKRDLQCVHVSSVVSVLQQTADYVVVEWSADPIAGTFRERLEPFREHLEPFGEYFAADGGLRGGEVVRVSHRSRSRPKI
jgi:hypothetical protein